MANEAMRAMIKGAMKGFRLRGSETMRASLLLKVNLKAEDHERFCSILYFKKRFILRERKWTQAKWK